MKRLLLLLCVSGCGSKPEIDAVRDLMEGREITRVFAPPTHAFAQPDPEVTALLEAPLTADSAAHIALARNGALRAALAELGVGRGMVLEAGAWPTPTLEVGFSRALEGDGHETDVELALEYDVARWLLTGGRTRVAEADRAARRREVAGQVLETAMVARQAFHGVQAAQQIFELRVQALKNRQAAWVVAEEVHKAGGSSALVLAQERAAIEVARLAVADAELKRAAAREHLRICLGLPGTETLKVESRLPEPPAAAISGDQLEQQAVEKSLDLAALRERLEAASGRSDLASTRAWLPRLGLGAHIDREQGAWEAGGHVAIGLPLLDEGWGAEAVAEAEHLGLQHRYLQAAIELRSAVRLAWTSAESARMRARHLRTAVLPAHQKVLDETQRAYNAMQISVFGLLAAQRTLLEAAVMDVEALEGFWRARLTLDTLLAGRHVAASELPGPTTPIAPAEAGH